MVESKNISAQVNSIASMFQIFFSDLPVIDYESANKSNRVKFMIYHGELLKKNVFVAPSQYETCFISSAHTDDDIQLTLEAMDYALNKLKNNKI